jgi:hypothetical protein
MSAADQQLMRIEKKRQEIMAIKTITVSVCIFLPVLFLLVCMMRHQAEIFSYQNSATLACYIVTTYIALELIFEGVLASEVTNIDLFPDEDMNKVRHVVNYVIGGLLALCSIGILYQEGMKCYNKYGESSSYGYQNDSVLDFFNFGRRKKKQKRKCG